MNKPNAPIKPLMYRDFDRYDLNITNKVRVGTDQIEVDNLLKELSNLKQMHGDEIWSITVKCVSHEDWDIEDFQFFFNFFRKNTQEELKNKELDYQKELERYRRDYATYQKKLEKWEDQELKRLMKKKQKEKDGK